MMGISSYGAGLQQAMLSANSALLQAKVQSGVKGQLDGRVNVLKAEIKQDKGSVIASKQEELDRVQKASEKLSEAQAGALEKANQAIEEAAKAEKEEQKAQPSKTDSASETKDSGDTEKADKKEAAAGKALYTSEGKLAEETSQPAALSLRA